MSHMAIDLRMPLWSDRCFWFRCGDSTVDIFKGKRNIIRIIHGRILIDSNYHRLYLMVGRQTNLPYNDHNFVGDPAVLRDYDQYLYGADAPHEPLSVTQLNQLVKQSLESKFNQLTVRGEIANFSRPLSGHIYFTLKDALSEIRCVFFRMHQGQDYLKLLKDGVAVELSGKVTIYPQRGQYQMMVSGLRLQGDGLLKQQFLELKRRLESQGLFDPSRKKSLPKYPSLIGVISSPRAAGLDDFLTILEQRFPACEVRLFTSPVQGNHAATSLIKALMCADNDPLVDVIVFCRGGGSMEDLWCFNDEQLAHSISACETPTISAVGHEKDITICDLCADVRAATPTNAAMLVAPDLSDLLDRLEQLRRQLVSLARTSLRSKQLTFAQLSARIQHPSTSIRNYQLALTQVTNGLVQTMTHSLNRYQCMHQGLSSKLSKALLQQCQQRSNYRFDVLHSRLINMMEHFTPQLRLRLETLQSRLHALDPKRVLKRGYAVIKRGREVVSSSRQLHPSDEVLLNFYDGEVTATINFKSSDECG